MPIAKLTAYFQAQIKQNPRDATAYYGLARVESARFALGVDAIDMIGTENQPDFGKTSPAQSTRRTNHTVSKSDVALLSSSFANYLKATQLDSKNGLAWFGLAFVAEEAIRFPGSSKQVALSAGLCKTSDTPVTARVALRSTAVAAYRNTINLTYNADLQRGFIQEYASEEAAQALIRLLRDHTPSDAEKAEISDLNDKMTDLKKSERMITPILVSRSNRASLADLLQSGSRSHFDLTGDGRYKSWPWIKPTTGILVWDPHHTGRITSGLQLFGNVTWWMFWDNGYSPLAALDSNKDGWLEGDKLRGIYVWFDRNGNGKSDPGEVVSLASLNIKRIAVKPESQKAVTLRNSHGIQFEDGTYGLTIDWTPTSLQDSPMEGKLRITK